MFGSLACIHKGRVDAAVRSLACVALVASVSACGHIHAKVGPVDGSIFTCPDKPIDAAITVTIDRTSGDIDIGGAFAPSALLDALSSRLGF